MLNNLEKLPDDATELKGLVTLLASELKNRDMKIADLQHQLAGHKRNRFGVKSESLEQLKLAPVPQISNLPSFSEPAQANC